MSAILTYAKKWASDHNFETGFVYFDGLCSPFGWSRELDNPSKFVPGVLAVELFTGRELIATGGNDDAGAHHWESGPNLRWHPTEEHTWLCDQCGCAMDAEEETCDCGHHRPSRAQT